MDKKGNQLENSVKTRIVISNNSHVVNASGTSFIELKKIPETFRTVNELNTLYIFVGLSAIIILIFVLRAMRFKSKKSSRIRRYGVKTLRGDVEMMPLDNEDDDEEATVFDITDHSGPQP